MCSDIFTGRFEFIDGLRRERCGTPLTWFLVNKANAVASISAARIADLPDRQQH